MNRFQTVREAKEYLISRILAKAGQDGISLSDVERNMLYFSESGWTLPNMMAVSRDFDQSYNQDEYERKIGKIVVRIRNQPGGNRDDSWNDAVRRLSDEDHYLSVLIDGASSSRGKLSGGDIVRLILAGIVAVAILLPISFFVFSHVNNPTLSKAIIVVTLLALVVLVAFVANRGHRESA